MFVRLEIGHQSNRLGVSGFQQRMSERFLNALESEIMASMIGLGETFEYSVIWGNDNDTYQFSGVDTFIQEDATASLLYANGGNVHDPNAVVTLSLLDDMIDSVARYRGHDSDPLMFIMSRQMISKVTALQTLVQRTVQSVEFEGGFRMMTYRGVPIMPSGFVRPAGTTTSPTVTATASAGGSLADDEYFYAISSVTKYGEQLVGVEDSATTATTNNSVTLTWTADANANLYKIWRGLATGHDNMDLLATIAARGYTATGAPTTAIATFIDNGSYGTPNASYVPLSAGEECIFLVNLDTQNGAALVGNLSPLGDAVDTFVSLVPLGIRSSALEFMIESFAALKVPLPQLHSVARRVRIAS